MLNVLTAAIAPMRPLPNDDILTLYGLKGIQASVARKDPVTGAKINKLRKSYAGKLTSLGVEGNTKVEIKEGHHGTSDPPDTLPMKDLTEIVNPAWEWPTGPNGETQWDERMKDFEIGGPSTNDLLSKLNGALTMKSGKLPKPEHDQWKNYLAFSDAKATPAPAPTAVKGAPGLSAANHAISKTSPLNGMRNSAPASPRGVARPDRAGKKRSYGEHTWEGYEDDGYSTGGQEGSGSKRQKRKVSAKGPGYYAQLQDRYD